MTELQFFYVCSMACINKSAIQSENGGGDRCLERKRCRGGLIIHSPDMRRFNCNDY